MSVRYVFESESIRFSQGKQQPEQWVELVSYHLCYLAERVQ